MMPRDPVDLSALPLDDAVEAIRRLTNTNRELIYDVINGRKTTKNKLLANKVSIYTGKDPNTYLHLVKEGVRIDPVREKAPALPSEEPQPFQMKIVKNEGIDLLSLDYVTLCDLHRDLMMLLAEVKYAMHGKCGHKNGEGGM